MSFSFIHYKRNLPKQRDIKSRVNDYKDYNGFWSKKDVIDQSSRCMGCGVPFCHQGCPLGNFIPDWNNLVSKSNWESALKSLHSTNNFPDFTGRICPAPCEASCVLNINNEPVAIEQIEKEISEKGWGMGWISPQIPTNRTGKKIAVIGSGPTGLAAAQQLNRLGHFVTVFEKDAKIGGLLRYGIPDFKLDKFIVERRVNQIIQEGVDFVPNAHVGVNIDTDDLIKDYDVLLLACGARHPRDLNIPGRDLEGIHFAMEYLTQQNVFNDPELDSNKKQILANGKNVIIIGGGDTGSDCLGTAHRQKAKNVYQFELLPKPPKRRSNDNPWPQWPKIFTSSGSHDEGGVREFGISTKKFNGKDGKLVSLSTVKVHNYNGGFKEIAGSEKDIPTDLVVLAMGFETPDLDDVVKKLRIKLSKNNHVETKSNGVTNINNVFAAGDMVIGQSIVVSAIAEGRKVADSINHYLNKIS
ncbi:MAG: glutamate synthase [Chloroflexi bacterium]|nr:glutamate synthase [Chloroflexota bacterium]